MSKVTVGSGIIIINPEGKILVGKRKGFVPMYSIPGGSFEPGEEFESGAIREVKEETDLDIKNPKVIGITNNLETFRKTGKHFMSVILFTNEFTGQPKVMEPEKCEAWAWCDPKQLLQPHFDASLMGVELYLKGKFYIPSTESNSS